MVLQNRRVLRRRVLPRKKSFFLAYDPSVERIIDSAKRTYVISQRIEDCRRANMNLLIYSTLFLALFGLSAAVIFSLLLPETRKYIISDEAIVLYIIICLAILYEITEHNRDNIKQYKKLLEKTRNDEKEKIKEKIDEDVFENAVKLSYKYLDEYYAQTREQAKEGFILTCLVAVFGAALIATGIVTMFLGKTEPAYVTCASGILTEFIASVFFYLYNKTITSMRNYHDKLVLSQNISIALKVAETVGEPDKNHVKTLIVEELIKNINSYLVEMEEAENGKIMQ